jgi:hypothetical protein
VVRDTEDPTLSRQMVHSSKDVSLRHRPRSTLQKHYFSASGTHFS